MQQQTRGLKNSSPAAAATAGVSVHPKCSVCQERTVDGDALLLHFRDCHFSCPLCEQEYHRAMAAAAAAADAGASEAPPSAEIVPVFGQIEELQHHYTQEHYPCPHRDLCPLTVYRNLTDLHMHIAAVHGGNSRPSSSSRAISAAAEASRGRGPQQVSPASTGNTFGSSAGPVALALRADYAAYRRLLISYLRQRRSHRGAPASAEAHAAGRASIAAITTSLPSRSSGSAPARTSGETPTSGAAPAETAAVSAAETAAADPDKWQEQEREALTRGACDSSNSDGGFRLPPGLSSRGEAFLSCVPPGAAATCSSILPSCAALQQLRDALPLLSQQREAAAVVAAAGRTAALTVLLLPDEDSKRISRLVCILFGTSCSSSASSMSSGKGDMLLLRNVVQSAKTTLPETPQGLLLLCLSLGASNSSKRLLLAEALQRLAVRMQQEEQAGKEGEQGCLPEQLGSQLSLGGVLGIGSAVCTPTMPPALPAFPALEPRVRIEQRPLQTAAVNPIWTDLQRVYFLQSSGTHSVCCLQFALGYHRRQQQQQPCQSQQQRQP
ncbi:hypothetical protein cyc_06650 [Cyclospora cayetanensis]|uniref:Uncharacterized protein n=1 Tax=Cyclospora cayetanensis TaxID=88456 RepID=A0A1D3D445_9EIME|nr:hypothetical protein cyc_06650 [Cyclospora cayetanensis]